MDSLNPKKIIVRMPNWLGDLVMATPILKALREKWPDAHITAMCQSNVASLLENDPNINEVLKFKRVSGWIHHLHHGEVINALRYGHYDLGILLTNSFSSAWWFWRGKVKNRIGFAGNVRNLLLNKAVPFPEKIASQHLVITYKMLLEPLGIPVSDDSPTLYLSPAEQTAARELLMRQGIVKGKNVIVGINPGAAYGTAKCWLPDRFLEVTRRLIEDPSVYVLYFGDNAGLSVVNDICKDLPTERVINLAGKTSIRELLALIQVCDGFLTNDSGPMHIAAALKVPLVALFGSTSDVKTGPYGIGKVIHKHVECSPCYKRVCPIDFRCMKRIEVDEVYRELKDILPRR
ncbi:MAG: lipopolysaccharide heptosyltransferase II [Parachlamydiaceae bacterium]|nr:lipopolysaccharide heptosyltransferase II [Parachlamydiaceae bacterium]